MLGSCVHFVCFGVWKGIVLFVLSCFGFLRNYGGSASAAAAAGAVAAVDAALGAAAADAGAAAAAAAAAMG